MKKQEECPDPETIKATRISLGLTQRESAEMIHAGIRAWQNWEQGARSMPYATWQYFLILTQQRLKRDVRLATGIALPDEGHPCAQSVRGVWKETGNLESARQALESCMERHHVDPSLANYTLAAHLARAPRSAPTPEEAGEGVRRKMERGANLLEIAEWFRVWG